jgi:hypothetical protein
LGTGAAGTASGRVGSGKPDSGRFWVDSVGSESLISVAQPMIQFSGIGTEKEFK